MTLNKTFDLHCVPAKTPPKITSDLSLRDMTIVAGHEISVTVPFTASPQPKAKWSLNGAEIFADDRVRMDISAHEAHSSFFGRVVSESVGQPYRNAPTNRVNPLQIQAVGNKVVTKFCFCKDQNRK